jgi:hypothetical protein
MRIKGLLKSTSCGNTMMYTSYCINKNVLDFIGTEEYYRHKNEHFSDTDLQTPVAEKEVFKLTDESIRADYKGRYENTKALYYSGQPDFDEMIEYIQQYLGKL